MIVGIAVGIAALAAAGGAARRPGNSAVHSIASPGRRCRSVPVTPGVVAPRSGLVEVDAIAEALEDSGQRVAELMSAERQFSANASHQLRSPLTAIAISLELIADSPDPVARREAAEALTQVAGLDDRINELLKLARTGRVAAQARTDVAALVGRHVKAIAAQFHRAGRQLTFVAPPSRRGRRHAECADPERRDPARQRAGPRRRRRRGARVGRSAQGRSRSRSATRVTSCVETRVGTDQDRRGHGLGLLLARNLLRADGGHGRAGVDGTDDVRHPPARAPVRAARSGPESGPHLLAHERGVGGGEQDDDTADQGGDLPPGQHEALGERERARQGLRGRESSTTRPVDWRDGFSSTPVASW